MISFASIDRIVGDEAILEVLMHTTTESVLLRPCEQSTCMISANKEIFPKEFEPYNEGDILVVKHEAGVISEILRKDEEEKERRMQARRNKKRIVLEV